MDDKKRQIVNIVLVSIIVISLGFVLFQSYSLRSRMVGGYTQATEKYNSLDIERQDLETKVSELDLSIAYNVNGISTKQLKEDTKLVEAFEKDLFTYESIKDYRKVREKFLDEALTIDKASESEFMKLYLPESEKEVVYKITPSDKTVKVSSSKVSDVKVHPLDWSSNGDITYLVEVSTDLKADKNVKSASIYHLVTVSGSPKKRNVTSVEEGEFVFNTK